MSVNTVESTAKPKPIFLLVADLLLVVILLAGAYLRLVGLNWGEYQYLHPDERFLVWVGTDISPLKCADPAIPVADCPPEQKSWLSLSEYFDTVNSTLNPQNRGHGFYVYGTLPMFLTRYVVEWVYGHSGFNEMTDAGRALSALADLITIFIVYLIAVRLYDRRVGLLAAAFTAATVLLIQQSHFFTMDTFLNLFIYLAIYFAVRIATHQVPAEPHGQPEELQGSGDDPPDPAIDLAIPDGAAQAVSGDVPAVRQTGALRGELAAFFRNPLFLLSVGFGVALGCAVSSKLNAAPVALMLPAAFGLRLLDTPADQRSRRFFEIIGYLTIGAVVSLLAFRMFQPYAFSGPGFLGIKPNPKWVANIREQRNQAAGDVDFPPALQWARRPIWFSGENMVLWGLGLPLGILSWAGFLWAGWRMLADKKPGHPEFQRHILLWGWIAFYFTWQSLQFNPTMRYELPIYPALAIFAAWAVFALANLGKDRGDRRMRWGSWLAAVLGGLVLLGTVAWAFAFTRIYARPITRVAASRWIYQNVPGPVNLKVDTGDGVLNQPLAVPTGFTLQAEGPLSINFNSRSDGTLKEIFLPHALDISADPAIKNMTVKIETDGAAQPLATGRISSDFNSTADSRGDGFSLVLDHPIHLEVDKPYHLILAVEGGNGAISLNGGAPANEGDWDDGLPLRLDGYDAYGGIYQPGLNFNMYTDDNAEKLDRFLGILDQADYLLISSNRQWGSLPRLPERFPLTTAYYMNLLGCPAEQSILDCYNRAKPGMFKGSLGYELVQVFQSDPSIGPFSINDQPAEEAFTVYDHPKVLIFKKTADYDANRVKEILGSVDLSQVVHVTPKKAGSNPANLMLPVERWVQQQVGGTWSELFNTDALQNRYPSLAVLVWYLSVGILGLLVYPIVRLALPGLDDRGYPLARVFGMLLLSYLVWLGGSMRIPVTRWMITVIILLIAVVSGVLAFYQRGDIRRPQGRRWVYYLAVEGLFLAFFLIDLWIRRSNPDLWHPWKGGEKPMDFSYFNAVLKSTTYPPYDPWYAGGYLNYYYYGYVLVGTLVKWLGIVPSVAYNLIIPTLFAMIAMGGFSLAWNLSVAGIRNGHTEDETPQKLPRSYPYWVGLAGAIGIAVLGNLGTVRMILQGYQRLVAPGGVVGDAGILTRWAWTLQGFFKAFGGATLPYSLGDWYWIPSRAIPAPGDVEPITEFPFFTVIYADLHAHLIALPVTLLALAFVVGVVLGRARWKGVVGAAAGFLLGGLAIGALRPTNTWDIYTYLALGCVALVYTIWMYYRPPEDHSTRRLSAFYNLPLVSQRLLVSAGAVLLLVLLSSLLYKPYSNWYALGYNKIDIWKGTHTPLGSYLVHWGVFLFVIITWMAWETREWLATTPLSALKKLDPYKIFIQLAVVFILAIIVVLTIGLKIAIVWFILPVAAWAGVLLFRPGMPDSKRILLFLVGTGLVLTLMVEAVVLRGDIGRMNTVFKFYLQVWTFFSISAAAALGWVIVSLPSWYSRWRTTFQVVLAGLVAGAFLFPLLSTMAKIEDRIDPRTPHTLDGLAYMQYADYADEWGDMNLSQDYRAIRWMQENVPGSPVIVEANLRNLYRWGSRFSIDTGLPGVVGWEWHQQQQRAVLPGSWVSDRIAEIDNFYLTTDIQKAIDFLKKYNVRYIILGQQERGYYSLPRLLQERGYANSQGLEKFEEADGKLWNEVYRDGDTVIYEVPQQN